MFLALAGVIVAIYYGAVTLKMARWTAWKDFRESCTEDEVRWYSRLAAFCFRLPRQSRGLHSKACSVALMVPTKPPPIVKRAVIQASRIHWTPVLLAVTLSANWCAVLVVFVSNQEQVVWV